MVDLGLVLLYDVVERNLADLHPLDNNKGRRRVGSCGGTGARRVSATSQSMIQISGDAFKVINKIDLFKK